MKYTTLGNSDIQISQLCLGGMSFGVPSNSFHSWTLNQEDSQTIIKHAFDLGITFIDTANVYANGTSEEFIGQAIKNLGINRNDIVLASKVFFNKGGSSSEAIHREIEGTLQRLQTDYLDLYILHRFDYNTDIEETMEALNDLVVQGKVRAIGASEMYAYQFHSMIQCAINHGWKTFSTMQCHYNLIYREDERELLPVCKQYGVLPTPYSPLASGHLARRTWNSDSKRSQTDQVLKNKYDGSRESDERIIERVAKVADDLGITMAQVALAWHFAHGEASPIVGCSKTSRVDEAVQTVDISLDASTIDYLEELYTAHELVGPLSRPGERENAGSGRATTK